jgi:hypothetical protein
MKEGAVILVLFVLLFVALGAFIAIGVITWREKYLRRQMWMGLADKYRMRYIRTDHFGIPELFKFALLQEGRGRQAFNCLDGTYQDLPVLLFDYRFITGWGKARKCHELSALLARLSIPCSHLIIRPETTMGRFAAFLGFGHIRLELDEFNRAFSVHCEDKKFAYDVCHPEMMEFILEYPNMSWELQGDHLLVYCLEVEFDPECVARCLEIAQGFAKRIPRYLKQKTPT